MWRINSVEEITTTTTEGFSDEDDPYNDPYNDLPVLSTASNPTKVPFPEAGIDFINVDINGEDTTEDVDVQLDPCAIKWIDLQNWEENWLFKKRKKCETNSEFLGYMAMVLAELPVSMLIPNPIDKIRPLIDDREVDELSELSEQNSFGSLEFSDTESEYESDVQNDKQINVKTEIKNHLNAENNVKERVDTIVKTTNDANNELMGTQVINKSKAVGNKNKPNVKLIAKVPNYLPKELRNNETCAKSDPFLVLMPGDACVQSGILVQFCCRAKGTKPLLFSWFKNDTILKTDENFRIFQSGEENVLEIKKTSPDFSAQYSCVVYNSCGYHWCDFTLKVQEFNFKSNNMSANQRHLKPKNHLTSKGVSNTNPKHEKYKYRPFVVQRTWAERVAELQNCNFVGQSLMNQIIDETNENLSDKENHIEEILQTSPVSGTIADREHKKWENSEVEWKDNPYSIENLNSRIQKRALESISDESSPEVIEEKTEDEEEVDNSFMSSKSKDLNRYKKDYYVKQTPQTDIKDENLRSFDENEYYNSKYFEINPTKRKLSEEVSQISETSLEKSSNETESEAIFSDSDVILPSVKDLVNRFASNEDILDKTPKLVDMKRKNSFSDTKLNHISRNMCQTNQSNFKVHSLTARSLTKEFRQMSHINLPRSQHNRMGINGQNPANCLIESESSSPTTTCSPTNEGYASDESNASSITSGPPVPQPIMNSKTNGERKFSRSILRRASYWEKRCEKGLISDSSVNEDFPPMEKFAN